MKSDKQYPDYIVLLCVSYVVGSLSFTYGLSHSIAPIEGMGVVLLVLTILLSVESIGKRTRDDILAELKPKEK